MKSQDKLFALIYSLSKGEKLYFRKFASRHIRHGKNIYIRLFEILERQCKDGEYNEKAVKEFFNDEKFINNFSVMKSYLYENILKSLNISRYDELYTQYNYTTILYSKKLYSQAWSILKKLKQRVIENEDYQFLLKILSREHELLRVNLNNSEKEIIRVFEEEEEAIKKIINLNMYRRRSAMLFSFRSKNGLVRDPGEKERIRKEIESDPFLSEDRALTQKAKLVYLHIKALYHFTILDFWAAYQYLNQQLSLIETTPSLRKNIGNYAFILSNLMYICTVIKKYDVMPGHLDKYEKLLTQEAPRLSKTTRSKLFSFYYMTKLELTVHTADLENLSVLLEETENFINGFSLEYENHSHLILNLSTSYFVIGEHERALYWINKMFNEYARENITSLIIPAKILNLFIHYELNNITYLEYAVKSFYHFLLKKGKVHKFEKTLLSFIRKLPEINNMDEFRMLLRIFLKKLEELKNDPFEAQIFLEYFDYTVWVESKIGNKPITEILKSRITG